MHKIVPAKNIYIFFLQLLPMREFQSGWNLCPCGFQVEMASLTALFTSGSTGVFDINSVNLAGNSVHGDGAAGHIGRMVKGSPQFMSQTIMQCLLYKKGHVACPQLVCFFPKQRTLFYE